MEIVYEQIEQALLHKISVKVGHKARYTYDIHSPETSFIFDEVKHRIIDRVYLYETSV